MREFLLAPFTTLVVSVYFSALLIVLPKGLGEEGKDGDVFEASHEHQN
jgi:hypothetical protein